MSKKVLVISDVDGCITTGQFIYTVDGKVGKIFGVNDHEGIKLLRKNSIDVEFITADKVGLPITLARMKELKCNCSVISENDRLDYIKSKLKDYDEVVFFGDGIGDAHVKHKCRNIVFAVPANARMQAKKIADYCSIYRGGDGAFMDIAYWVCDHILGRYDDLYK